MKFLVRNNNRGNQAGNLLAQFTAREKEIMELIIQEYSNGEIAEKLFISHRTVEAHKRKMIEKTGSKNMAGLITFATKNGLVEY